MSRVFFISDPHFGHKKMLEFSDGWRAKVLGNISTLEEHDDTMVRRINSVVGKRDILYILGDLGYGFHRINDIHCEKRIHLGNHDGKKIEEYTSLHNTKVVPCMSYKKHWLTHIPIHPAEMRKAFKNVHGHVHSNSIRDEKYVNMSVELTCGWPIPFDYIRDGKFTTHEVFTAEDAHSQIKSLGFYE